MQTNRRSFLISSFILSSFALTPKCLRSFELENTSLQLSDYKTKAVAKIQLHLFPKGKGNPSAKEANAAGFLQKVLLDEDYDKDIRIGIYENIERITQQSKSDMGKNILVLSDSELEELLINVRNTWGETFLSLLLLFIIEALFSDPIYGHNQPETGKGGWDWISHIPGIPQANEYNRYEALV